MNWFFPYKKETAAVAVPESVCHYSQVIVAGLALLCRKNCCNLHFFGRAMCHTCNVLCHQCSAVRKYCRWQQCFARPVHYTCPQSAPTAQFASPGVQAWCTMHSTDTPGVYEVHCTCNVHCKGTHLHGHFSRAVYTVSALFHNINC